VSDAMKREATERKEDREGEIFIESGKELKIFDRDIHDLTMLVKNDDENNQTTSN